jgi:hypothetical protein
MRPDLPFSLESKDQTGNVYQVSRTLRQKTDGTFQADPIALDFQFKSEGRYTSSSRLEPILGEVYSSREVNWYGDSVELRRK